MLLQSGIHGNICDPYLENPLGLAVGTVISSGSY